MAIQSTYHLLMLRCWREEGQSNSVWRCRVKDVHTGREIGFSSVEELLRFLDGTLDRESPQDRPNMEPGETL